MTESFKLELSTNEQIVFPDLSSLFTENEMKVESKVEEEKDELIEKFYSLIKLIQKPDNYLPRKFNPNYQFDQWTKGGYSFVLTEYTATLLKKSGGVFEFSITLSNDKLVLKNISREDFLLINF